MTGKVLKRMLFFVLFLGFGLVAMATGALLRNAPVWSAAPGFAHRLNTYLTQNTAQLSAQSRFPELGSPLLPMTRDEASEAIRRVAKRLGWQTIEDTLPTGNIHFVVSSEMLGFKDDVVVSLMQWKGAYLVLAYAKSRLGRADFAANANHLVQFKQALLLDLRAKGLTFDLS